MSTLDITGMAFPFKVNRPLNDHEQQHRFSIKTPAGTKPHYVLSLIKLNNTFVECVDKWYAMRGYTAMAGAAFLAFFGTILVMGVSDLLQGEPFDYVLAFLLLMATALFFIAIYIFTRDAFTYTHYPIRFNRKNRQVYVFRRNGTVLKICWDNIYWTIYGHGVGTHDLFVAGHVMDEDKITVKETFGLSVTTAGKPGEEKLKNHFEFFRRYMEEGPAQVLDAIKPAPLIMLPGIDKVRESWAFGWERLTLHENGSLLGMSLYQVFAFPESFFRWFAMQTSKIPQWPQWVEDECAIEPNDIWVRDGPHRA
ncbi:DUF6708 domain-containing protein [Hydrogenophaga palleronii]|uniref:DUF6708 domain-containing protein n=1 Tax=Hydrogenophaga palleronii TaxID=65655 RepID=UPI000A6D3822|nr:DUF6708 domain-containing protein [Hydrogenophaga palleronii]